MKKNLIIVEGSSDKKFFKALLVKEDLINKFAVEKITEGGGKTEFKFNNIKALLNQFANKDPNQNFPDNVLLICDADFEKTRKPLCGFKENKTFLDNLVTNFNNLVEDESSKEKKRKYPNTDFHFFILPNNKDDGNLESLFLQCATKKITEKSSCVDGYLECLDENFLKSLSINKADKLRSQLLVLAIGIQKGFGDVGDVADEKAGYWNLDHKALEPLKKFLKKFN